MNSLLCCTRCCYNSRRQRRKHASEIKNIVTIRAITAESPAVLATRGLESKRQSQKLTLRACLIKTIRIEKTLKEPSEEGPLPENRLRGQGGSGVVGDGNHGNLLQA